MALLPDEVLRAVNAFVINNEARQLEMERLRMRVADLESSNLCVARHSIHGVVSWREMVATLLDEMDGPGYRPRNLRL